MPGLLSDAHGGVLYVDESHLLDRHVAHHIARTLNTGAVSLEREGLSAQLRADFIFVGSYDPTEGTPPSMLAHSVAFHLTEGVHLSREERADVVHRVAAFDLDPEAFAREYAAEGLKLQAMIAEAQSLLPQVIIKTEDRRRLSLVGHRLGVEGHRADLFADRAARAGAAFHGRTVVMENDLEMAIRLVLAPRAQATGRAISDWPPESLVSPTSKQEEAPPSTPHEVDLDADHGTPQTGRSPVAPIEDLIIEAIDAPLPDDLLDALRGTSQEMTGGRSAGRQGRVPESLNFERGRYVRAVEKSSRSRKIALEATLRAALPFQRERRRAGAGSSSERAIRVAADDLRFKQFRQKSGMLILFVIDASGSMALNRMDQAKGAVTRLLQKAHLHRDHVALIGFRGQRAEVLLPPSRSVQLAKRALDALPVGGGTPLAAGLLAASEVARRAQSRRARQTLIVLLTDGRANVGLDGGRADPDQKTIWAELERIGAQLQSNGLFSVVIDTQSAFLSQGSGQRLAGLLGGRYINLPRPDAEAVYNSVAAAADSLRRAWQTGARARNTLRP